MTDKKVNCESDNCKCASTADQGHWQDVHHKQIITGQYKDEFKEGEFDSFSIVKGRRDFLKIMGFSFTMLPIAACTKSTVRKAVPFLEKNDVIIPGVSAWFATTHDGVPLLVKTREGRPIKIEGNDKSKWSLGGASAISQASILSLYDSYRLKTPTKDAVGISWNLFEKDFLEALNVSKNDNKKIAIISEEIRSPSTIELLKDFKSKFDHLEHIVYTAKSKSFVSKSLEVPESDFYYLFSNASYVLSFASDFLGTDDQSVTYSRHYAEKKSLKNGSIPLKHIQIESLLSLTGSNADERYPYDINEMKALLLLILSRIGGDDVKVSVTKDLSDLADKIAKDLLLYKKKSIVISGIADLDFQVIINKINLLLENFGSTIHSCKSDFFKLGDEEKFEQLLNSLLSSKNEYGAIIFMDVNPYYSYRDSERIKEAFSRVHPKFALTFSEDETSVNCEYVAPIHHIYESWNDSITGPKELSVTQAVIRPLYETKQIQNIILKSLGRSETFDEYMKVVWSKYFFRKNEKYLTLDGFWTSTVHDGVVELPDLVNDVLVKDKNVLKTGVS